MSQQKYERPVRMFPPMPELDTYEKWENAPAVFKEMRDKSPIRFDPDRNMWDVFLYEDVDNILKNPFIFSSKIDRTGGITLGFSEIIYQDPPTHKIWRGLQEKSFTPQHLRRLIPRIYQIVDELLDRALPTGTLRIVKDIGDVLPTRVVAALIGVPDDDWVKLRDWTREWLSVPKDERGDYTADDKAFEETMERKARVLSQMHDLMREHLELRKKDPKDDLLSTIWYHNEQLGEDKLPEKYLIHHLAFLLGAGSDTTSSAICNAMRVLVEYPEVQERLASEPELFGSFVEEVLRFHPNVMVLPRVVKEDYEYKGHQMKAGQYVNCYILSANRDERKFPNPEEFIVDRKPNPHFGFGIGPHYCMGAPLARIEIQAVYEQLLKRVKNLRRVPGEEYRLHAYPIWTMQEYAVQFDYR